MSEEAFRQWRRDMQQTLRMLAESWIFNTTAVNILITELAEIKGTDSSEIRERIDTLLKERGFTMSQHQEDPDEILRRLLDDFEGDGTVN